MTFFKKRDMIAGQTIQMSISLEQLFQLLDQLSKEEKIQIADQLQQSAFSGTKLTKQASFTVLKTGGNVFTFNREEANER